MDWSESLESLQSALERAQRARAELETFETQAAADIAKYARHSGGNGIELDVDAIKQMVTRPYTLLPINESEAWLIQARVVKMPMVGWLVAQDGAFNKFRVTRSMDLLTPLPTWMKTELGWKPPEHQAQIDGTRTSVRLTDGKEETFKRKYGATLGKKNADGTWQIKGGDAWIKLVANLVRDGILPYAANPVAPEHWNPDAALDPQLLRVLEKLAWQTKRPFLQRAVDEFRAKGAVLVNYPPGAGKTLVACLVLNYFRGRVLILADTTILVEQWRDRVKTFATNSKAKITVSTYQGAQKYLDQEWDLIIPDEAQRLPANTFSKLAFVKTKYRLGLTGTPWREDDRQHLIVALSGFPVAVRWSELVNAGVLKRPRIIVATVPNEAAKTGYVRSLLQKRKGRTIIFCDWIEQGNALANALDVPFIHGETRNKLERLQESDVAVVSRIGDRGVDLHDLRLVIEVAGQGAAREQFAQRVGRLLHGDFAGEFHTVFTPDEAEKFRPRVFGVEAELAGEVDIEFLNADFSAAHAGGAKNRILTVGNVPEREHKVVRVSPRVTITARTPKAATAARTTKPVSELEQMLAVPAVAKLIQQADAKAGVKARGYVRKALEVCWDSPVTIEELRIGKGIGDEGLGRYRAGFREAVAVGLIQDLGGGRFLADKSKIRKIVELAQRFK